MAGKTTVRELLARLGFEVDDAPLKKWDAGIASAKKGMGDLTRTIAIGAGVIAGVTGALLAVAASAAAVGDEARKTGQAVGVTTEQYQELAYAAGIAADATAQELGVALKTQARNAEGASRGTGEAVEVYRALGISALDAAGKLKPQLQLLRETADAFKAGAAAGRETAFAQKLFGESGTKLIPLLTSGAAGIDHLRARAHELGLVMSDEAGRAAENFNDSLTELRSGLSGLKNTLGTALFPVLQPVVESMRDWLIVNRQVIAANLKGWAAGVGAAIAAITPIVRTVDVVVRRVLGGWGPLMAITTVAVVGLATAIFGLGVAAGVAQVVWGLVAALSALAGIIGVGLLPLIGLIALALASMVVVSLPTLIVIGGAVAALTAVFGLLYLGIEDVYTYLQGGDSLIGRFLEQWRGTDGVLGQVVRTLDALGALIVVVGEDLSVLGQIGSEALSALAGVFYDLGAAVSEVVKEQFGPLLTAMGQLADAAGLAWLMQYEAQWATLAATIERVVMAGTNAGHVLRGALGAVRSVSQGLDERRADRGGNLFQRPQITPEMPTRQGGQVIHDNRSVSVTAPISVSGAADPAAVADAVSERLGRELRSARAVYSVGGR